MPSYCNNMHHSIHFVPPHCFSPADSASFNCLPHLVVPMEFTHNALRLRSGSSPLPQATLTSSLNTPRHLYIHPAISQAPVPCVFLFGQSCWPPASVYCVVRKQSIRSSGPGFRRGLWETGCVSFILIPGLNTHKWPIRSCPCRPLALTVSGC